MLSLLDHHITGLFDNIKMKPCGVTIQVKPLCQTFWLSLEVFDVTKVKLMEVYKVIIVNLNLNLKVRVTYFIHLIITLCF